MSERRARARRRAEGPLLGLVMIVRNEADVLERCLSTLLSRDLVDTWTVCDTGSTDATRDVVRQILGDKPGRLYRHKWRDFAYNRTLALRRARGSARWLLMCDADYVVTAPDGFRDLIRQDPIPVDAWNVLVREGGIEYRVPRLIRGSAELRYRCPTHEYLETDLVGTMPGLELEVFHFADGANRAEKFERDLALLAPGVEAGDPRSTYYTAQTLRDLGHVQAAAAMYARRARQNGWDEERWHASYQAAKLRRDPEALLECWRDRPWRHEPLTALAELVAADPRAELDALFREPRPAG